LAYCKHPEKEVVPKAFVHFNMAILSHTQETPNRREKKRDKI
jgi:hypothetical protein